MAGLGSTPSGLYTGDSINVVQSLLGCVYAGRLRFLTSPLALNRSENSLSRRDFGVPLI